MVVGLSLSTPLGAIEARFDVTVPEFDTPNPSIVPGDQVVVLTPARPGEASLRRWGYHPEHGSEALHTTVPEDRLDDDPTVSRGFDVGRVLVLADGVRFETGWLVNAERTPFALAGLDLGVDGTDGDGVTLITVDHGDRDPDPVPVVVPPEKVEIWLHYSHATQLSALLEAPSPTAFSWRPTTE